MSYFDVNKAIDKLQKYGLLNSNYRSTVKHREKRRVREEFEIKAIDLICDGKELPPELEKKLLDTLEERRKRDEAYYGKSNKSIDLGEGITEHDIHNLTGIDIVKLTEGNRKERQLEKAKVDKLEKYMESTPGAEESFIRRAQAYLKNKLASNKKG